MPSTSPTPYRQLQPEDRLTLASVVQQKHSIRAMARVLGRPPSTVIRELRHNASSEGYANQGAHERATDRRTSGCPAPELHPQRILFAMVRQFLGLRWSPEQIALKLASIYAYDDLYYLELAAQHETPSELFRDQAAGHYRS